MALPLNISAVTSPALANQGTQLVGAVKNSQAIQNQLTSAASGGLTGIAGSAGATLVSAANKLLSNPQGFKDLIPSGSVSGESIAVSAKNFFKAQTAELEARALAVKNAVSSGVASVEKVIEQGASGLQSGVSGAVSGISGIADRVTAGIANVNVSGTLSSLTSGNTSIGGANVSSIVSSVGSAASKLVSGATTTLEKAASSVGSVSLSSLPSAGSLTAGAGSLLSAAGSLKSPFSAEAFNNPLINQLKTQISQATSQAMNPPNPIASVGAAIGTVPRPQGLDFQRLISSPKITVPNFAPPMPGMLADSAVTQAMYAKISDADLTYTGDDPTIYERVNSERVRRGLTPLPQPDQKV